MKEQKPRPQILIHGYELVMTCGACPEQYELLDRNGTQVAYLRLRHGYFYCAVPDVGGTKVYEAYPSGDGCFDDEERLKHLKKAVKAVQKHLVNDYYKQCMSEPLDFEWMKQLIAKSRENKPQNEETK
mgnify:CR=1 FL=1